MKPVFVLAMIAVASLSGCFITPDEEEELIDDITVSLSADTMWVWEGGGREFTIDLNSGSAEEFTMAFADPATSQPTEVPLQLGSNSFRFDVKPIFYTKTDVKRMEMTFSQPGRKPVTKHLFLVVGGTKVPLEFLSTPGTASRMSIYSFDLKTHPGASITMHNPITGGTETGFATLTDGRTRFTDGLDNKAPLGQHTFRFVAKRTNFEDSEEITSVLTVTE
jgi:hypothetical protein